MTKKCQGWLTPTSRELSLLENGPEGTELKRWKVRLDKGILLTWRHSPIIQDLISWQRTQGSILGSCRKLPSAHTCTAQKCEKSTPHQLTFSLHQMRTQQEGGPHQEPNQPASWSQTSRLSRTSLKGSVAGKNSRGATWVKE